MKSAKSPTKIGGNGAQGVQTGPYKYGRYWPEDYHDLSIELVCFRDGLTVTQGGLGRAEHFWKIVEILWGPGSNKPFVRNPWSEQMVAEAAVNKWLSVSGCGSSGKTDTFAVWAIVSWLCAPTLTKVMVTSTTLKESRRRIWGSIVDYWTAMPEDAKIGDLVDSAGIIRLGKEWGKVSDRSGIELIAGERKKEKEAVGKIIGVKNQRIVLICDELPELSYALIHAAEGNLSSTPNLQVIGVGNPASIYDAHGLLSTPKNGWKSVSPKDFRWETKNGIAIRFDAELSPNILAQDDTLYPFLPKSWQLAEARRDLGDNSFMYWRMWRGFWCPEGAENTVYSEADISHYDADTTEIEWARPPTPVAGLDAGYTSGGDRSIAYFGLLGIELSSNRTVLMFTGYVLLQDDPTDKLPRNFQIVAAYRKECEKRGVIPFHAGYDVTGAPAFGDIVAQVWSVEVMRVTFGGRASNKPIGVRKKPAIELYGNRSTEMWFRARDFMASRQLRGIEPDLAAELTARKYTGSKSGDEVVFTVEPKEKMKTRIGKSPDIADAALVLVDVVFSRLKFRAIETTVKSTRVSRATGEAQKKARKTNAVRSLMTPGARPQLGGVSMGRGLRTLR